MTQFPPSELQPPVEREILGIAPLLRYGGCGGRAVKRVIAAAEAVEDETRPHGFARTTSDGRRPVSANGPAANGPTAHRTAAAIAATAASATTATEAATSGWAAAAGPADRADRAVHGQDAGRWRAPPERM